jgi:anaerobic ribonucleoside-triphosphate reductase activating protein
MKVRMHAYLPHSRANGPGLRAVVWFQGCTLGCPGCFNRDAQALDAGQERDTALMMADIGAVTDIEGVTFSGGEPFQQPEALLELSQSAQALGLSVVIFSGYTLNAIQEQPLGPAILNHVDTLIAGSYDAARHNPRGLIGSNNQQVHHLSARYKNVDFTTLPSREAIIQADGSTILTGVNPPAIRDVSKPIDDAAHQNEEHQNGTSASAFRRPAQREHTTTRPTE